MPEDPHIRIAKAVEKLNNTVETLNKTVKATQVAAAKLQHPAYQNRPQQAVGVLEETLSTTFSLSLPDIQGQAQFYIQEDGFLRIEILIEPPESERLVGLVDSMGIREFVVSAVAYDECD